MTKSTQPAKPAAGKTAVAVKKPAAKKPAAKKTPAKPVAAAKKPAASDAKKPQMKVKLVRDSFTLPEVDHDLIKQCKKAAIAGGRETKKSEVVRAAIRAFSELSTAQQLAAYAKLQSIAVGRPKSK
jgi:hypothetical protein